jgi:hypothetical protein
MPEQDCYHCFAGKADLDPCDWCERDRLLRNSPSVKA